MKEVLGPRLDALEQRLAALWEQACDLPGRPVPPSLSLEELSTAVEELHVAAEELAGAEARLAEEQRRYRDLFEFAPDGYAVTDADGLILDANRACAELVGVDAPRLAGRPLTVYLTGRGSDGAVHDQLARLRHGADHVYGEGRVRRRGGGELPVTVRAGAARDGRGRLAEVRWLIHDDTDRIRAAEAEQVVAERLREDAARLARLDKAKSDFLNLVSHELRGPLALLRGYTSMLADGSLGPLTESAAAAMPVMIGRCDEMAALVNQMLETARLDDSRVQLVRRRVDLRDLAAEAARSMGPRSQATGHSIRLTLPDQPVTVEVDRSRVMTILTNLLDNAVKYSPHQPEVGCSVSVDPGAGTAAVAVTDRGMGIADPTLLFSRFGRVVTPENSHIPGTGLGLYLARELARMHGGDVVAVSTPGRGSRFTLSLPLAVEAQPR